MIDKLNLSDEHKKLLEIYKKRNLMEELNFQRIIQRASKTNKPKVIINGFAYRLI